MDDVKISKKYLLPKEKQEWLLKNYGKYYPEQFSFVWAYCRYFWEAHPIMIDLPMVELGKIDNQLQ